MDNFRGSFSYYVSSANNATRFRRRQRHILKDRPARKEVKRSGSAYEARSVGIDRHHKSMPEKEKRYRREGTLPKTRSTKLNSDTRDSIQTESNLSTQKKPISTQGPVYNVYIHGYCEVGKTLLLRQLVSSCSQESREFEEDNLHGVEASVKADVDSKESVLHFTEIDVLRKGNFKDAQIHLVVFSLNDSSSMKYAVERITHLRWKNRIECPIIIVGNKADIVRNRPTFSNDLKFLSKKLNCFYMESSAFLSYGTDDIMTCITAHANCETVDCFDRKRTNSFGQVLMKYIKFWKK